MNRNTFNRCIRESDFRELFISEMGWNNYSGQSDITPIAVDEIEYQPKTIADRNGFQIITCDVRAIPTTTVCKKIDIKLRRWANDYICIYAIPGTEHHLWVAPIKTVEKRELVTIEYNEARAADFLFSKIDNLSFDLDELTTIMDVKERIQGAFAVNSEKITKDFYAGFKKEHKAFADFITGIDDHIIVKDNRNKQWYTSVMLNRLMFCYFIQKKGFLDSDTDYLQKKLREVRQQKGENRFFKSFYRGFLSRLFHDGLNAPSHSEEFENNYGRIPYLNGGMFDEHQLEKDYKDIDIADEAFIRLFDFFDKWRWHLDTRITASGKDINPDVLGYIFEQYINDRAQMGAYYTKEDITEYIGKNCIIPFLFDKVKINMSDEFSTDGYVWRELQMSGDKYVYDAVKKGYTSSWRERIPQEIAIGLDTSSPDLLKRRSQWNTKTSEEFALPTEIWRETIERFKRCDDVIDRVCNGKIHEINDFITYNLDIRTFVYDLLSHTPDSDFIKHFYYALQNVTVLDPTCGSGAFLFAAMNILEPLYEICIDRMQEFHSKDSRLFASELAEISNKYRSNIQYFIFKSIILRNLYGVDIMVEATEIAKLRLFLKMLAVVEVDRRADNLGLDPLPDIDFNIRCGNTLVGYATEEELENDLTYGDMFANLEFKEAVENEMKCVSESYESFRRIQLNQSEDMAAYKQAKGNLKLRLSSLNELLNRRLYGTAQIEYTDWLESHQPFHWLAEFYQIIKGNGGFDVIIGNPPYVEYPSKDVQYKFDSLATSQCGNLYGCCTERGIKISQPNGRFSFIIPVAITCSKRMEDAIELLKRTSSALYFANFDDRPGKLFEMIQHLRATIFIAHKSDSKQSATIFATKYNRWYTECRSLLFDSLCYTDVTKFSTSFIIPKISYPIECQINDKLHRIKYVTANYYGGRSSNESVYFRAAGGGYFLLIKNQKSITFINGVLEDVKAEKEIKIDDAYNNTSIGAILSSTLFYWNYIAYTDCRNLTKGFIDNFPIPLSAVEDKIIVNDGNALFADYEANKRTKDTYYQSTGRNVVYDEYYPKLSKQYIDSIDITLAKHYCFTDEELDFIINYDIKYRMGDELNNDSIA